MRCRLIASVAVAVLAFLAPRVSAGQSSAVDTLLSRARVALNDLQYGRAQILARDLVSSPGLTSGQRIAALQILASAFFPEEEEERKADSAMTALRQLVRADPTATLPRDITWGGLDSLLDVARRTTYVASAKPDASYSLVGPAGEASIAVTANRPSIFKLSVVSATGATVATDSIGPTLSGALRFRALNGTRPLLQSGAHSFVISAADPASRDSIVTRFAGTIEAAPLAFDPVPGAIEQSVLRPERFPPDRVKAYSAAGLLAAGTVAMAVLMRADEPVRSAFSVDAKAILAAVGLAGGAIWAGLSDKGGPLPANVTYNDNLKREHAARIAAANTENERRLNAYRVQVTISGEER